MEIEPGTVHHYHHQMGDEQPTIHVTVSKNSKSKNWEFKITGHPTEAQMDEAVNDAKLMAEKLEEALA